MVKHGEWCPGGKPRRLLMRGVYRVLSWFGPRMIAAAVLLLTGCTALTTDVLVDETGRPRPAVATHRAGRYGRCAGPPDALRRPGPGRAELQTAVTCLLGRG